MKSKFQFWRRSVNRHGVHSPFVFDLLEKGLRTRRGEPLLARLRAYFGTAEVQVVDATAVSALLDNTPAEAAVLYIPAIHQSDAAFRLWMEAAQHPAVRLSLEFWEGGLLFFRKDFQVRQHFVLWYKR